MISYEELKAILNNNDRQFIENLAQQARAIAIQFLGRSISIYAPIYLSNYCDNHCVYCGFNHEREIERKKLTLEEMHQEMAKVANSGIRNILLLTGDSRKMTPVDYIKSAVNVAKSYFSSISLEIYPLETNEYNELFQAGVDGITIYQETYDKERYRQLHTKGKKIDYNYRYETPERIAKSGIRMISMGILLGLAEVSQDIYHLFTHLEWLEKKYPGVEYSLSFPRLIPMRGSEVNYFEVLDITLIKLLCLARIQFPRVGINLSTREKPYLRDHALPLGVNKISAASCTRVGGYTLRYPRQGEYQENLQFQVMDNRSVAQIVTMLLQNGFDPVFTDWRRISNEATGTTKKNFVCTPEELTN